MKIKMTCDASHRISSALSQSFKAGRRYSVPQETGEALIKRGVADAVQTKRPKSEKE